MVEVWLIDENGFYTGKYDCVEEPNGNEITKPYAIGYVKGKWDFELQDWVEGATEEEIQEWEDSQQIVNCPPQPPTNEDLNSQLIETQKLCLSLQKQILLK